MRHITEISEHEMVALFLKTEIQSTRWGSDIVRQLDHDDVTRKIIDYPDITNSSENEYRLRLMGEFRGYRRNKGLFEGFPERVAWERVTLTRSQLPPAEAGGLQLGSNDAAVDSTRPRVALSFGISPAASGWLTPVASNRAALRPMLTAAIVSAWPEKPHRIQENVL